MLDTSSNFKCETCTHSKVCLYKEEYVKLINKIKVIAEPTKDSFPVSVGCSFYGLSITTYRRNSG